MWAQTSYLDTLQACLMKTTDILHVLGNCSYKTYTTMPPSGSTFHHSNMLFPEEGVCLLNSSCVQHILELRENKWKLSNGDILTFDPDTQFPWHFPVMWMLDHCWERLPMTLFLQGETKFVYRRNKHLHIRILYVAYQLLNFTVVLFRGWETPLVLQAEIWGSVKERIHLRHGVQSGQGLERERDM